MITKTINYTDFNNVERTETFYFNMTDAELTAWEKSVDGGMSQHIMDIINAKNEKELILLFQDIIDRSYGKKSADGRRFEKNAEILADFKSTQAYSDLYMSLVTDANKATEFVNALVPKKRAAAAANDATASANSVVALPMA